jgi:hypothetical protein
MRRTLRRSAFWLGLFIWLAAATTAANADVTYYYTGSPLTNIMPGMCPGAAPPSSCVLYNPSDFIAGDVVLSSPLPDSVAGFSPTLPANVGVGSPVVLQSFSFTDGVNTITNATIAASISSTENFSFTTNSSGAITLGEVGLATEVPSTGPTGTTYSSALIAAGGPNGDLAEYSQPSASGDCCLAASATSSTPGTWTGPVSEMPPPPGPSLYLTVNTGGPNSAPTTAFPDGQPTSITAQLTLATTAPALPNTIQLTVDIPSDVTTIPELAAKLGFSAFDWVQIADLAPPGAAYANYAPDVRVVGVTNDPPPSGWTYFANSPQTIGANPYPFNFEPASLNPDQSHIYSVAHALTMGSTVLNFFDQPGNPCLPPVSAVGGYTGNPIRDSLYSTENCFPEDPAPSGASDSFVTELVGVIPVGSICPDTACYEQGASNNGFPTILPLGEICPDTVISCYSLLLDDLGGQVADFDWTDTFNGEAGGIASNYLGTIDPESGAGGIAILSIDGMQVQVPEPSSATLLLAGLCWFVGMSWLKASRKCEIASQKSAIMSS